MAENDEKSKYYDEVDEEAYERSAQNRTEPDPTVHDLWQSTNISTDGSGPTVAEVAPVFAQARADALAHPVTADDDDDKVASEQADAADAAAERAENIRQSNGYVAATGADAGIYDDPKLKDAVPAENFSERPDDADEPVEHESANAPAGNVVTDDDGAFQSQTGLPGAGGAHAEGGTPAAPEGEDVENTPESPTDEDNELAKNNEGDTTHDDLVSDTAGEQGGLDATSADGATPKDENAEDHN